MPACMHAHANPTRMECTRSAKIAASEAVEPLTDLYVQLVANGVGEAALGVIRGQICGRHPTVGEHDLLQCAPRRCHKRDSSQRAVISVDARIADESLLDRLQSSIGALLVPRGD